jgi:hypothetical protein
MIRKQTPMTVTGRIKTVHDEYSKADAMIWILHVRIGLDGVE